MTHTKDFRACALVPCYNHAQAVRTVLTRLTGMGLEVVLVDDGSNPDQARQLDAIVREFAGRVTLIHREANGGKGAACITGFREAMKLGFTHALQVDADAQHDINAAPGFLEAAREYPASLICAYPVYDASAPAARRFGHKVTNFWVAVNTWGRGPADSMGGFRVYPLAATLAVIDHTHMGLRMDFDLDVVVQLTWAGMPVVNRSVKVTYPEGGLSHFKALKDNVSISAMHARHCTLMILDALHLVRHYRLPPELRGEGK